MSLTITCSGDDGLALAIAAARKYGADNKIANWTVDYYGPYAPARSQAVNSTDPPNITQLVALGPQGYIVIGYQKGTGPTNAS